jgi:FtsP/CotA-like multicopper oxidase with cupredoxin domain
VSRSPAVRVNGAIRPDIAVRTGERLWLRMINASSARGLSVKLEGHAAWVMAIDGQPAELFPARQPDRARPGNRADLFVDTIHNPGTQPASRRCARRATDRTVCLRKYGNMRARSDRSPGPCPPTRCRRII